MVVPGPVGVHWYLEEKKNTPGCRSPDNQRGIKQSSRLRRAGKRGKAYRKLTTSAKVCEFNFSRTMQTGVTT